MWILHDVEVDALWELLGPAHEGREGAVFAALATWFRKVSVRIQAELQREAVTIDDMQNMEKWLNDMQREIQGLSSSRGVPLPPPRSRPGATSERVGALIAELVALLEYLAVRPEFNEEAGRRHEN